MDHVGIMQPVPKPSETQTRLPRPPVAPVLARATWTLGFGTA